MPSIDERIVAMSFENAKFEAGVAQTMNTLQKLNDRLATIGSVNAFADVEKAASKVTLETPMSALDKLKARLGMVGANAGEGFSEIDKAGSKVTLEAPMSALDRLRAHLGMVGANAGDGFSEIEKASSRVSLSGVGNAIDSVTARFSTLQAAASVALGNISSMAAMRGAQFVKSFSFGPLIQGFQEYAINLNSIQTILANTQASGAGLKDVNSALNELNTYSDKTIYNFSEMAKNIGTFTAAGVGLKESTAAIKGIANLAALSGSNSQQASTAMYQLSQAIASGRVSLQDWNSVVNAGMGGTVFQRALANTAQSMGALKDGAVKLVGPMKNVTVHGKSFRESIMAKPGEQSWLTSDVLTKTLSQFTGDLSAAELKAQGFDDAQIKAIQQTAKTAQQAATQVKTVSQVFDVLKETIGSGWAKTFQTIFGDFGESKKLFTQFSNYLNGLVNASANARNKVLGDWKALGGRTNLIQGLKNAWADLLALIKPIKDAFREIFPAKTGRDLADITKNFRDLTESLKIGPATALSLKRTFAGLFAVLDIGKTVVKEVFRVIVSLLGIAGKGAGGFLQFTGSIGDFLVALDKVLVKGGALHGMFSGIISVLKIPITLLGALAHAIASLFEGSDSGASKKFGDDMSSLADKLKPIKGVLQAVANAWHTLLGFLQGVGSSISPLLGQIGEKFSQFASIVADAVRHADYSKVFDAIQTVLIGGIFLTIKKALGGGSSLSLLGGINVSGFTGVLKALEGNLTALQKNVQAGTLLKIAAAIGILAAGITALSLVKEKPLTRAMSAVAIGLGELVGALALLGKFSKGGAFLSLPIIAASMVVLATAVTILAGAVMIFSKLSWEGLIKGLAGVAGVLVAVAAGVRLMPLNLALVAASLIPLGLAINILAAAVLMFAKLSWKELVTGLLGVGGALVAVGISMQYFGPQTVLIGVGLMGVAFAMNMLAGAVSSFGHLKLDELAKGVIGIAASLVAIGLAMQAIPPTVAVQAAGLVILSLALAGIAGAIGILGKMKIETIIKGLTAIAGVLLIFAVGLQAMAGTLVGSAALMAAAVALAILAPTLVILGHLKWETIIKGLVAIAGVLATIAVVGGLAAPLLSALGLAMLPLAAALLISAGAAWLLSKALQSLSDTGVKGVALMITAITAFVAVLPKIVIDFVKGLVSIIQEMAKMAPQILGAMTKILETLIQTVINAAPKLAVAIGVLVVAILKVLVDNTPRLLEAGAQLILSFLQGLAANIPKIVPEAAKVIVGFLTTLASQIPKIITAGATLLIKLLEGIARNMFRVIASAAKVVNNFLLGIAKQSPAVIRSAVTMLASWLNGIASNLWKIIDAGANIIIKFLSGLTRKMPGVAAAAINLIGAFIVAIANSLVRLADKGAEAVISFINGVANAIHKHSQELWNAGWNLAWAIIEGLLRGFTTMVTKIWDKIKGLVNGILGWVSDALDIFSPSGVFEYFGRMMGLGLAQGIDKSAGSSLHSTKKMVGNILDATSSIPEALTNMMDFDPTITPVLDLSAVERDAAKLQDLTNVTPITAAASYKAAATISTEKTAADTATAAQDVKTAPTLKFEQNNYSPEALSDIDIYRQTRNQLSQVKSVLGLT